MNYLAHAFLSNNDKDLLIGNFIADHLRGNNFSTYPKEIIEGILLHRKIDSFTDTHSAFKASKRLFYNGFEKHSGILVDIYFDHLLAANFESYSKIPLENFSKDVYRVYSNHQHLLPASSSRFLDYVVRNNIYTGYADLESIERVLFHLSHRIRHLVALDKSVGLFLEHEKQLKENFKVFFDEALLTFPNGDPPLLK
jgi:acyl carrier protein phosphodiesterase